MGTEIDVPTIVNRKIEETGIANINAMLVFTKGPDDFASAIPMG